MAPVWAAGSLGSPYAAKYCSGGEGGGVRRVVGMANSGGQPGYPPRQSAGYVQWRNVTWIPVTGYNNSNQLIEVEDSSLDNANAKRLVHDVFIDDEEEGDREDTAMDTSTMGYKTINNNNSNNNNGQNNNGQNNNNDDQHAVENMCSVETFSMGMKGDMMNGTVRQPMSLSEDSATGSMDEGKSDVSIDGSIRGLGNCWEGGNSMIDMDVGMASAITSSSSSSGSASSTATVMQTDPAPATCQSYWKNGSGNAGVVVDGAGARMIPQGPTVTGERRRRKLPEIPKTKKAWNRGCNGGGVSLAEELGEALGGAVGGIGHSNYKTMAGLGPPHQSSGHSDMGQLPGSSSQGSGQGLLYLKCTSTSMYLRDDDSSPDSELSRCCFAVGDDSGNSTAHSPDGPRSNSPLGVMHQHHFIIGPGGDGIISPRARIDSVSPPISPTSSCLSVGSTDAGMSMAMSADSQRVLAGGGGVPYSRLKLLEATHRGLHKFLPRHHDEIEVEIGDPIYVQKEADDLWCEGVNLRTGRRGIFPSAHVVDIEYADFDPSAPKIRRERYLLGYLGSVEALAHKGNRVLRQAVNKIVGSGLNKKGEQTGEAAYQRRPHSCILEVSDQGIRMVDKSKPSTHQAPCHDYFYSLKHVSYCGFLPSDPRYLGFITKHPRLYRFACHVFLADQSTRPVAEAVGRAFQRFYQKFIETAYPIEDIYLE